MEYKGYKIKIIKMVGSVVSYGSEITKPDGKSLTEWDGSSRIDLQRVIDDSKTIIDSEILYEEIEKNESYGKATRTGILLGEEK